MIAGVTLALTQPIRVGDLVEIGDQRGRVEDLTLTFTWLRTADGRRVALPNELLMTQPLRNETLVENAIVPSATRVDRTGRRRRTCARGAARRSTASSEAGVDEIAAEGVRLRVAARRPARRAARASAEGELARSGARGPPRGRRRAAAPGVTRETTI